MWRNVNKYQRDFTIWKINSHDWNALKNLMERGSCGYLKRFLWSLNEFYKVLYNDILVDLLDKIIYENNFERQSNAFHWWDIKITVEISHRKP